jgi:predicted  nucleic acid-binding Zn-ribbon protein
MELHGLHPTLELRLEALAQRIRSLREKMKRAQGSEQIEDLADIQQLERRYEILAQRLQALDNKGPGVRQDAEAELERLTDDLSAVIEDFGMRIDSHYAAEGRRGTSW